MNSVYDKVFPNQPISNVLQKKFHLFPLYHFFCSSQNELEHLI